jgi:hypothetical protein
MKTPAEKIITGLLVLVVGTAVALTTGFGIAMIVLAWAIFWRLFLGFWGLIVLAFLVGHVINIFEGRKR